MKSLGLRFLGVFFILVSVDARSASTLLPHNWEVCFPGESCLNGKDAAEIKSIFQNHQGMHTRATVNIKISRSDLEKTNWLYIGEVGDTANVTLNSHPILDLTDSHKQPKYFRYLSLFTYIPPNFISDINILSFQIIDLNETLFGLRSTLALGSFSDVLQLASYDFLMRTGSSLLSVFTLIFLTTLSLIALYFLRKKQLLYLAIYGVISILYLISFSEIPRTLFDPVLFSGPVHFSLRFFQDLALCLLILSVLRHTNHRKLRYRLSAAYLFAIGVLWIVYFQSKSFIGVQKAMLYFAPLVALPTFFGLLLSRDLPNLAERSVNVKVFTFLTVLQLNDLMVFWQVYEGHFFVKWYIPLIFVYIFYCLLLRYSTDSKEFALKILLGNTLKQFAHDIRSPLTSLKCGLSNLSVPENELENVSLIKKSADRLSEIAESIFRFQTVKDESSVHLFQNKLVEVCEVFRKCNDIAISLSLAPADGLFLSITNTELIRVVVNLIQNSSEAVETIRPEISISVFVKLGKLLITVRDNGPGFPREIIAGLGKPVTSSSKIDGSGIGLAYCAHTVEKAGGYIKLTRNRPRGAMVEITLPAKSRPMA